MSGLCMSRIFPTICVHMCSVVRVSCHSFSGKLGQTSECNSSKFCSLLVIRSPLCCALKGPFNSCEYVADLYASLQKFYDPLLRKSLSNERRRSLQCEKRRSARPYLESSNKFQAG